MKYILVFFNLIGFAYSLIGQPTDKNEEIFGAISYISRQYYYVEFPNTKGMKIGDTLYVKNNDILLPVLIVEHFSERSCAAVLLNNAEIKFDDKIYALIKNFVSQTKGNNIDSAKVKSKIISAGFETKEYISNSNENKIFNGKIAVTSYTNFNNYNSNRFSQKWHYLLNLYGENMSNNKFDYETYVVYSYNNNDGSYTKNNIGNSLKIYDFNIKYKINFNNSLIFGRKINNKISNLGTVDGIQYEISLDRYFGGLIIGSRPNFFDYGLNLKLFQYGVYFGRSDTIDNKSMINTISFINQTNNFKIDRRFLYLQHTNTLINKLNIFLSSELDLYKVRNKIPENKLLFSSFYSSLNYSPYKWLSLTTSYDARKNVIYYETFKSFVDSLIENETRQGVALRTNIKINNILFFSLNYGYRFKTGDNRTNKNFGGSLGFNNVSIINANCNINYSKLSSSYLDGNSYGILISRNFIDGFFDMGLGLKRVNYKFINYNYQLKQDIISIDLTFYISKKMFFAINYEGVFEKNRTSGSLYCNVSQRF